MKCKVFPSRVPGEWDVVSRAAGEVGMATFRGENAEARAREYASWKNGETPGECRLGEADSTMEQANPFYDVR